MRQPTVLRVLATWVAILQLALPGFSAWGEARLQAESRGNPGSHVESHTTSHCPRTHDADCGVCRYLSNNLPLAPSAAEPPPVVARLTAPPATRCVWVESADLELARSRAPPALLMA